MRDYITEFDQCYLRFERVNSHKISDMMLAYDLLVSCNLSDRGRQLVKAALGQSQSFSNW